MPKDKQLLTLNVLLKRNKYEKLENTKVRMIIIKKKITPKKMK